MSKILMIFAIVANALGFGGISKEIDRNNVDDNKVRAATEILELPEIQRQPELKDGAPEISVNAKAYVLVEPKSGKVFSEYNSNEKLSIASTTKIMNALVVVENYSLDDLVTVGPNSIGVSGSKAGLTKGEVISVRALLKCMLIKSGNDAAYALANNLGDNGVALFVEKMNQKAKQLGMNNTEYFDSAGLNDDGKSTAYDLSLAAKALLGNEELSKIVTISTETVYDQSGKIKHDLVNTNYLITEKYEGALGIKTGSTEKSGNCLVSAVKKGENTLIAVVLDSKVKSAKAPAEESKKLYTWGFQNIVWPN